ncbi:ABC transporter ATP-binding protein [Nocardia sp. alder85J]|uniref:ABC transporter ATP-binding protein n=1 Tax=Nocardia sp. alder85J TaxID=2862949 RepID=UPI001CD744D1|nr:ABC transporter ATP-binding protein [Nocardia sp. alder85J]MCX4095602.1 ABC transporter ATP-binding protein [Nocardia sp. alder85J]
MSETDMRAGATAVPKEIGAVVLKATGLDVGYGDTLVVRGLDLEVRAGEVVALLGANGAGKSTTISALAGILQPSAGSVTWRGQPARGSLHRRVRRGLALVPEQRSVIFGLSTKDNLRMGRGSIGAALDLFPELKPFLSRKAGLLSGGQQQMLTLARALATEPELLLADELSLGLAPLVVDRLLAAVRQAADRGAAVLLVEQQVRKALKNSDRAYVLRRGRIALEGRSSDLLGRIAEIEQSYLSEEISA